MEGNNANNYNSIFINISNDKRLENNTKNKYIRKKKNNICEFMYINFNINSKYK